MALEGLAQLSRGGIQELDSVIPRTGCQQPTIRYYTQDTRSFHPPTSPRSVPSPVSLDSEATGSGDS
ncbi:predicted protein [Histoplasma mississippiense (nom. inval.)]|uniref:predicted protein n=1 Tax=Ajellomyces capsulatus (strain NAm1 / WU24) TaxID=2059318 RepID=UPI000157C04B|nr:predicted protein [Histoplasma mississippiense (nom. inval.)]EDN07076.1 predicted protein [Histoplasma mississippiense (nom. inval.)]